MPNNFANVTEWMADVDPQDRCGYGALQIHRVNVGEDGSMTKTRANAGMGGGNVCRAPLTFSPAHIHSPPLCSRLAGAPLARQVPNYLTLAMGTCTEATTTMERGNLGYSLGLPAQKVTQYGYIGQSSELCDGVWFSGAQIVSYWLDFISVVVLLAFFTREFYKTKSRADEFDYANVTTSDFSVMLEGLDRAVEVDDKTVVENGEVLVEKGLTSKLIGDLEQMGFKLGEEVYSIEVARVCKAAIKNMTKLAKLRTQRQELQAGRLKASNVVGGSSRASKESLPVAARSREGGTHENRASLVGGSCRGEGCTRTCRRPEKGRAAHGRSRPGPTPPPLTHTTTAGGSEHEGHVRGGGYSRTNRQGRAPKVRVSRSCPRAQLSSPRPSTLPPPCLHLHSTPAGPPALPGAPRGCEKRARRRRRASVFARSSRTPHTCRRGCRIGWSSCCKRRSTTRRSR